MRLRSIALTALCLLPMMGAAAHAQSATDLLLRLDRLEAENRRLNGQVEQLGNQVRRLEENQKKFQADVDFRFKEAGGGASAGAPAPAPKPSAPKKSDAFDAGANPGSPGTPKTIGQLAAEATGEPGKPGSLTPGSAAKGGATSPAPAGSARAAYDTANGMLERGEYEAADMAFRDFIKSHGKDKLKPDAVFGLGESLYRRNRYREAAEQFLAVTTDHGKSPRAPEAMLKLGMSLRGLGATPEACGTYSEVSKKYPNASAAIKQAVDREKKRAQCAA